MKPLISIITVCYNSAETVARTVESVLHQTYEKIEYLVIDGDSSDQTVDIVKGYEKAFEEKGYTLQIISEPDKGIYDAMNKGVRLAKGEIIGIINSDDWYEKQAVERMVDTYLETPFDMFYADVRIVGGKHDIIKRSRLRKLVVSRDWNHPTTFITKKVYNRYQYKLESLHDDWDLVLRIRKADLKIVILNEVLANFQIGGISNDKTLKKCIARGKARYKIYRNNGYSRWYWFECVLIEAVKFVLA